MVSKTEFIDAWTSHINEIKGIWPHKENAEKWRTAIDNLIEVVKSEAELKTFDGDENV